MAVTNIETTLEPKRFESFREFYPYYLANHSDRNCRRMHFIGTVVAVSGAAVAIATLNPAWAIAGVVSVYALGWTGHFLFERNRPLAWTHFFWSMRGDAVMFTQMLLGKIPF